jgi:hypothetical protein
MNFITPLFEVKYKQWNKYEQRDFDIICYHYGLTFNLG